MLRYFGLTIVTALLSIPGTLWGALTEVKDGLVWTYEETSNGACLLHVGADPSNPELSTIDKGYVVIPSILGMKGVTSIGARAFAGCTWLKSLSIPSCVTSIGKDAFVGCTGLGDGIIIVDGCVLTINKRTTQEHSPKNLNLPARLIADELFKGDTEIETVNISSAMKNIGANAFDGCTGIMAFNVGQDNTVYKSVNGLLLTKDGTRLLYGVSGTATIPDGVISISGSAFRGCNLTSLSIPQSVQKIEEGAFQNCSGLGSGVVVTDGCVLTINGDCPSLVQLPQNTRLVADGVFRNCGNLLSVKIPESVNVIGMDAFKGCTGLGEGVVVIDNCVLTINGTCPDVIDISNDVRLIAEGVFKDCSEIKAVSLSSLVSSVKDVFPSSYKTIEQVILHDGIKTINEGLFAGCKALKSVTLPESVRVIRNYAFDQTSIRSLRIPESLYILYSKAFSRSDMLTMEIVFEGPKPVAIEGGEAIDFSSCSAVGVVPSYYYEWKPLLASDPDIKYKWYVDWEFSCSPYKNGVSIDGTTLDGTDIIDEAGPRNLTIPSMSEGRNVVAISPNAFSRYYTLSSVSIPEGVLEIGEGAFSSCPNLLSATFGAGLKRIGAQAFGDLSSWCQFKSSDGVVRVGDWLIRVEQPTVSRFEIPSDIHHIADGAFSQCAELSEVLIHENVESIGKDAFAGTKLWQKQGVGPVVIDGWLLGWKGNRPDGELLVPLNIVHVADSAFSDSSNLTKVVIPPNVKTIGVYSFAGCTKLESVMLDDEATVIGFRSFDGCAENLKFEKHKFEEGQQYGVTWLFRSWDGVLQMSGTGEMYSTTDASNYDWYKWRKEIRKVEIGEGFTSVGSCAFQGCENVEAISLPSTMRTIGSRAFSGCQSLTTISLPAGLSVVEERAFEDCKSLKSIVFPSKVNSLGEGVFNGCEILRTVHYQGNCPSASNAIYNGSPATLVSVAESARSGWPDADMWMGRELRSFQIACISPYPCDTDEGQLFAISGIMADLGYVGYYAIDKITVSQEDIEYSGPFKVKSDGTVSCVIYLEDKIVLPNKTLSIVGSTAVPKIEVREVCYGTNEVSISCDTIGASIYYELNETNNVSTKSMLYSRPFIVTKNTMVSAFAISEGKFNSCEAKEFCEFCVPAPTITTYAEGEYSSYNGAYYDVYISCADTKAEIRYTTDGSEPNASSPLYRYSIRFTDGVVIKARAFKEGWTESEIVSREIKPVLKALDDLYIHASTPNGWNGLVEIQYYLSKNVRREKGKLYPIVRLWDRSNGQEVWSQEEYYLTVPASTLGFHSVIWDAAAQGVKISGNVNVELSLVANDDGNETVLQSMWGYDISTVNTIRDIPNVTMQSEVSLPVNFSWVERDAEYDVVKLYVNGKYKSTHQKEDAIIASPNEPGTNEFSIVFYNDDLACSKAISKYAYVAPKPCTVSFDPNGGGAVSAITCLQGSTLGTLPTTSRMGYSFLGWFTAAQGGEKIEIGVRIMDATTFYAHWEPVRYTIHFHANGGSCATTEASCIGVDGILNMPTPTRDGCVFKGWYDAPVGGRQLSSGDRIYTDVNVYAHWQACPPKVFPCAKVFYDGEPIAVYAKSFDESCVVHYRTDGGCPTIQDAILSSVIYVNEPCTVCFIAEKEGCESSDPVSVVVAPGDETETMEVKCTTSCWPLDAKWSWTIAQNNDASIHVQGDETTWLKATLEGVGTLSFDWRGSLKLGDFSNYESTSYVSFSYDNDYKSYSAWLTNVEFDENVSITFTENKKHNIQWAVMTGLDTDSCDLSISNIKWRPQGAQVELERLNVEIVGGGDVVGEGAYKDGSVVNLLALPDEGYEFDSWSGGCVSVEPETSIAVVADENIVATFRPCSPDFLHEAKSSEEGVELEWVSLPWARQYNIYRSENEHRGEVPFVALSAEEGNSWVDSSGEFNQMYFYWVEAVGEDVSAVSKNSVSGARVYEEGVSRIIYENLQGASHGNPLKYREGTKVSFMPPSERMGYTFVGWSPNEISEDMTGDVVVTAEWKANVYKVVYHVNGGSCMTDQETFVGVDGMPNLPITTRVGCIFKGWFDAPIGGQRLDSGDKMFHDVDAYAQWQVLPPTVYPGPKVYSDEGRPIAIFAKTENESAKIYYRVDGVLPTIHDQCVTEVIHVDRPTTFIFIAALEGCENSEPVTLVVSESEMAGGAKVQCETTSTPRDERWLWKFGQDDSASAHIEGSVSSWLNATIEGRGTLTFEWSGVLNGTWTGAIFEYGQDQYIVYGGWMLERFSETISISFDEDGKHDVSWSISGDVGGTCDMMVSNIKWKPFGMSDGLKRVMIETTGEGVVVGAGAYENGANARICAIPAAGYGFGGWEGDRSSAESELLVPVVTDMSMIANFNPLAPDFLHEAESSIGGVALEWKSLPWATQYKIYRSENDERPDSPLVVLAATGDCTWVDSSGALGKEYFYWVSAIGENGVCTFSSNKVNGTRIRKDAIPELPETASPADVREALAGSVDLKLEENINDASAYSKYRTWAMKIGADDVKQSEFAWVSFALDSVALLKKCPEDTDLSIEEFRQTAEYGKFDFTVNVKDVEIGSSALAENLKKVFGLTGAETLDVGEFKPENVEVEFGVPKCGKLKFTAKPAKVSDRFFMRVKVK